MDFRARLRRNSSIYRMWIGATMPKMSISGVSFRRVGRDFVSVDDPLPGEAVSALVGHGMVDLEVSTAPIGNVVVVPNEDEDPDEDGNTPTGGSPAPTENQDPFAPDALAALWRHGDDGKQEPVMRRRGRPPGPR